MIDDFTGRYASDQLIPITRAYAITPDDTNPVPRLPRAVRFDGAGSVVLRTVDATADVTINVGAGDTLDWRIQFIRATGTTATGILGLN